MYNSFLQHTMPISLYLVTQREWSPPVTPMDKSPFLPVALIPTNHIRGLLILWKEDTKHSNEEMPYIHRGRQRISVANRKRDDSEICSLPLVAKGNWIAVYWMIAIQKSELLFLDMSCIATSPKILRIERRGSYSCGKRGQLK